MTGKTKPLSTVSLAGLALDRPGLSVLAGLPEGFDALVLARLAAQAAPASVVHVAQDDARLARVDGCLGFFAPEIERITIPAWDCLPYDRVSPRGDLMSQRVASLMRLAQGGAGPRVVLTTVNALLQRVLPRSMLADAVFELRVGDELDLDALLAYLENNGFVRAGTVMESGDYAVRGGIIDIFPPSAEEPVRLDLFGTTIDAIRAFDPSTQRSAEAVERFSLSPVSEVLLTPDSIALFRAGYRELFGAVTDDDPLYEAISGGRRYPGMEHWLPLFHERLETIFDFVPGAIFALDHLAEQARDDRLETIDDHYRARAEAPSGGGRLGESGYKPIPADRMYLSQEEWDRRLAEHAHAQCVPFAQEDAPERRTFDLGGRAGRDFMAERAQIHGELFQAVGAHLASEQHKGQRVLVAPWSIGTRERIKRLLAEHEIDHVVAVDSWSDTTRLAPNEAALGVVPIEHGFSAPGLTVIAEQDILGERLNRAQRRRRVKTEDFLADASELSEGDLVVHVDHGIGRYDGLVTIDVDGAPHDCLRVLYADADRLFLPVENIELLSRYGSADQPVPLDRLGGAAWQARKARLKQRIREMAAELIKVAAARTLKETPPLQAHATPYDEFCARFPYAETEDQARSIDDTVLDLSSGRPMDRLICGDVGFGKTEVALRAAFIAAMAGKQVAVLVPTTLLCRQHYETFRQRFQGLPARIAQLSRLVSAKTAADVREGLTEGAIDIVIGTHALLGKGITFHDLGLLIVDEEQHFGVAHKERIKRLRAEVHVLTLTATPIPRTLQMALSGVRDMSIIATPPVDRLAVRTFILPFDAVVLREAILREHLRGGQTFYVCPRIADLDGVAERVRRMAPEVKVAVAHGRMAARKLEDVMVRFYDGAFDVLVSTAIVESGLDLPRVNTIVVHRADMFGLAQLYQLRGRIGRSKLRGYAYLTYPSEHRLTSAARKRLDVIHRLDSLGAGFSLASHDMDIRGAGNLLGPEQSGHVREVGIELYQHMLEAAVAEARAAAGGEAAPHEPDWSPHISIGTGVQLPETYVQDLDVRLGLYRRIARLEDRAEIDAFIDEMNDRFGPPPDAVLHLLEIVAIKRQCRVAGVERIDAGPKGAVLSFREDSFANLEGLVAYVTDARHGARLRPDSKLIITRNWSAPRERLVGVQRVLDDLAGLVSAAKAA